MYSKANVDKSKPIKNVEKEKNSMNKNRNSVVLNLEKVHNPLE